MTKNKLWSIYVKKNPSFEGDGTVTMTCKGLRKFFDTTWDTAYYSQCLPPEAYMRLWKAVAENQHTPKFKSTYKPKKMTTLLPPKNANAELQAVWQ